MRGPIPRWMEAHQAELTRHLARMVDDPDDVADVLQHVWVRAWQRFPDGDGAEVRAWLYRVATNAALDRIAYRTRWRSRLQAFAADPDAIRVDAPAAPLSERTAGVVRAALAALPPRQREAVWFRCVEGRDYGDVAERMGGTPEGARANVHHGLKRLRRALADLAEEE